MREFISDKAMNQIVRLAFDKISEDKPDQIDLKKLEKIIERISTDMGVEPPKEQEIEKEFKRIDKEEKNYINYDQFFQLIKKFLLSLLNNDTVDENDDNIGI